MHVEPYIAAIGAEFMFETIVVDNITYNLQFWDTPVQNPFVTSSYYNCGAHGILGF